MMVLLTLVAIAMLSLSTIEQRSSGGGANEADRMARANARMALMMALGELQKAAGPDQRVTATSTLLGDSGNTYTSGTTAVDGKKHWVGVWDTSSYSPATPDAKTFVRWLVSGDQDQLDTIADAGTAASAADMVIFEGVDASGNPDPDGPDSVKVPKVEVATTSGNTSYYAYWVEDQGVKADLEWNETLASDTSAAELERAQVRRLSASSGPDYGVLGGPFASGVTYPLKEGGSNTWIDDMAKAFSPADMGLVMGSTADHSAWIKANRHNMAMKVRGVMADVKKGGLRRDLSLAFEMDGDKEIVRKNPATNAWDPALFNQQVGEFVGSGNGDDPSAAGYDLLSAPAKPFGLPTYERLLWRHYNADDSGSPFNQSLPVASVFRNERLVMRGPNWWALRDYYNLYKRLSGTGGNYAMKARAYYPNRSTERWLALSDQHEVHHTGQTWDREYVTNGRTDPYGSSTGINAGGYRYAYRPAQAPYAPVCLGHTALIGIQARDYDATLPKPLSLALTLDPLFYLWNPYNRRITCDQMTLILGNGVPGDVKFKITDGAEAPTVYTKSIYGLLTNNVTYLKGSKIIFLLKGPFTLEPGEVVIASPLPGGAANPTGTGEMALGYSLANDTGVIMTKLDGQNTIRTSLNATVDFTFLRTNVTSSDGGNDAAHELDVSLTKAGWSLGQILADLHRKVGDQTQHNLQVLWSGDQGMSRYTNPAGTDASTYVRSELMSNLIDIPGGAVPQKVIFGAHGLLIKPTSPGGGDTADPSGVNLHPSEIFSRLNPRTWHMQRDMYQASSPNQIYLHATANTDFAVRDLMGIDYSGSSRGAFWGLSYQNTGSTHVPMCNIPSSPMMSLADFAHANLSYNSTDPFRAVGNSWSCPMISPDQAFGLVRPSTWDQRAQDFSWLINDALFDRYYFSGIAPDFTIGTGGYSATGTLKATLDNFYGVTGTSYKDAKANPAVAPHVPAGKTADDIVTELTPTVSNGDGYKKMGAYSLIKGAFNVNSTSVKAWEALLRANKDLAVQYAEAGASAAAGGSPFPSSGAPNAPGIGGAKPYWSGFSRLTDAQIASLAAGIVDQVKLRGPFMSISDFVNHKMGTVNNATSYTGAIQAALDIESGTGGSGINAVSKAAATNSAAVDANSIAGTISYPSRYFPHPGPISQRRSSEAIPTDITQADILRPLAPRLSARTDTFRVRGYGEVTDADGNVIAKAMCEAVVQRLPEYVDAETDPNDNEPWDEFDPDAAAADTLNATNKIYGRRFEIQSFRWLDESEV
jgi:hypothetical protein